MADERDMANGAASTTEGVVGSAPSESVDWETTSASAPASETPTSASVAPAPAPMPDGAALMYDPKPGSVGVTVSFPDACSARLDVVAPAAEVAAALADARASLARRCGLSDDVEGLAALATQVDEAEATSFTAGFVLDHLAARAFMRTGIMPFGAPDVTVDELPQADRDLAFSLSVLVRPVFELIDYDAPVTLDASPEPSEADITAWIDAMAASLAAQAALSSSPTSPAADAPTASAPVGAAPAALPVAASAPAAPAALVIDDAWVAANMPEAGDLAGLRARVRTLLARTCHSEALDACAAKLGERLTHPVDERYVDVRLQEERDRETQRLAREGMTLAGYLAREGITEQAWGQARRTAIRARLAADFALDALADHLGLQVDETAIAQALTYASRSSESEVFDDLAWAAETGQTHRLCEYTLRHLAAEWLLAHAVVAQSPKR